MKFLAPNEIRTPNAFLPLLWLLCGFLITAVPQGAWCQTKPQPLPSPGAAAAAPAADTGSPLSFSLIPAATIPFGDGAASYSVGGAATLSVLWPLPFLRLLAVGAELGYDFQPIILINQSLSSISAGLSARVNLGMGPWFIFTPFASGGYFVAMPSRKMSDRCPRCAGKNHLGAKFCNSCGRPLPQNRAKKDPKGRTKLHADVAHPISTECRRRIQEALAVAYREEVERSKQPGYRPIDDESDDDVLGMNR